MARPPRSKLLDDTWDPELRGLGQLRLAVATLQHVKLVDTDWPPLRPADGPHKEWLWDEWFDHRGDRFVVEQEDGNPVACWSSEPPTISLEGKQWYRLDFWEAHPNQTGQGLGAFVFLLICSRALELGCQGLVLEAFRRERLLEFYAELGGVQRKVKGWNNSSRLLPFAFEEAVLADARSYVDAARTGNQDQDDSEDE